MFFNTYDSQQPVNDDSSINNNSSKAKKTFTPSIQLQQIRSNNSPIRCKWYKSYEKNIK